MQEEVAVTALPLDLLEDTKGRSSREHVRDPAVGAEIERRFKQFLRMYTIQTSPNKKGG